MLTNDMVTTESAATIFTKKTIDEEEFFAKSLFQDVLEMKSIQQVSDATAIEARKIQDEAYQCLFKLFQKTRGIQTEENGENDVFGLFELFFKQYYQHFRAAMEELINNTKSPVKVAYILGQKSDKIAQALDSLIKEIESELK